MSIIDVKYPWGKAPFKKGDVIEVRGVKYQVMQYEPLLVRSSHQNVTTGLVSRINTIIPPSGRIYYFQFVKTNNMNVDILIQRPEGQPHISADSAIQYLEGPDISQNRYFIPFSVINNESLAVQFFCASSENIEIKFYGYKLHVKQLSENINASVDLEDFIELNR